MKGRLHRLQSSDPPDDWVDGSWTVDCICGVNFDDGEEMVKCDECGVWVHTRCSRYVKGDDMFACDKCKSKSIRTDAEETEVAQLLVELPTKTVRMESSFTSNVPSRRPFKLWADVPIEEKVHVHGIPGGDPSLFGDLSSMFSSQLWKCTGYVPKKFNFQCREFPCWDKNSRTDQEIENPIDKEAGVLLSFSKESVLNVPVEALVDVRAREEEDGFDRKTSSKEMNKCETDDRQAVKYSQNDMKNERSLLRPVMHSGKRKKEDSGASKERSGKKRVKSSEKEPDPKRRSSHSSKTAFKPTSDAKPLEFYEDRDPKIFKADTWSLNNKKLKDLVIQEHISEDYVAVDTIMDESNNNVATTEDSSEALYPDMPGHSFAAGDAITEEETGQKYQAVVEISSKTDDAVKPVLEHNYVGNASIKEQEEDGDSIVVRSVVGPSTEDPCGSTKEHKDNQLIKQFDCDKSPRPAQCKFKVKREGDDDKSRKLLIFHSPPKNDNKNNERPSDHMSDNVKVNDTMVSSSPSHEIKVEDVDRKSEVAVDHHTNKPDELSGDFGHEKQELEGSEGSVDVQRKTLETKDGLNFAEEPSKSDPLKMLSSFGKSSSTSSTINSRSLGNDFRSEDPQITGNDFRSEDPQIPNTAAKHGLLADCNSHSRKGSCSGDVVKDEVPRKSVRERSKSSLNSHLKAQHASKSAQSSVSKQRSSDSKHSIHCSPKSSSIQQTAVSSGTSDFNASLNHQKALQSQRGEKLNQTNSQSSSKLNQNNVSSINPSPTSNSAMLSDEELALLLHQELNSSPRVPRVPRARNAGSLPQLTSSSVTSMLIKRSSSAGGKDHYLISRRKYKDASRDALFSSHELEDESKKVEKVSSSPDQRKQDVAYMEGASVKEESHPSMTVINSIAKNAAPDSSVTANSSPSSPTNDRNLSSTHDSSKNASDGDTGTARRPVHRTLPGLINEIMSKGRRMTYEELCNAVLPHWNNLRKHNGERYAYSSHSQAVLDCLRNRHEWARLVDRGPKTNANRKRRKIDTEESDDSGYSKGRTTKEVDGKNFELQKEEFPKGKRKARKRRRLALQGRAVKDVRKKQKADSLTDEDVGALSNTTEESMFSEEEIQGGRKYAVGSEASASSDEEGSE
ncbi:hypothetical protein L6164_017215 [Bauhinia variegata]|uniref:Uncharacterized protein n=1 Tax=Bauhinia variegata TaxID=167791 RepID=A0ACB9N706_BAUVA|nr:hypothetical protein L6164_017215 [Bauhinia variegata]